MMLDDDDAARVGLWVVLGAVAFVLFGLVGALVLQRMGPRAPVPEAAPLVVEAARPPPPIEDLDIPLHGKPLAVVYFALGRADVYPAGAAAVDKAALAVRDGGRLLLTGFHDTTGDPQRNAELAKERAKAVKDALVQAGVDAQRVLLRKPLNAADNAKAREARRVEIRMMVP
jgi:K(+)-stimulated pyrophosphate-energized sodium pump